MYKNKYNQIRIIIILCLLILAFILGRCDRHKKLIPNIVYLKDTTTHIGVNPAPISVNQGVQYIVKWKDSLTTIHDTINKEVLVIDTAMCMAIAKDYYTKYSYHRELVNDSILTFTLHDTTFMNKLTTSSYEYKINRPQTIIVNRQPRPVKVYGGANLFYSKEIGFKPTAGVLITTKNLSMFYGLGNKCQNFGIYISF
jgi:hypothetical protein